MLCQILAQVCSSVILKHGKPLQDDISPTVLAEQAKQLHWLNPQGRLRPPSWPKRGNTPQTRLCPGDWTPFITSPVLHVTCYGGN